MNIKYRISKYNPKFRENNWEEIEATWTSYSDIGNIYQGRKFTIEEYENTENKYISLISDILSYYNVKKLIIKKLEINFSVNEIDCFFNNVGLILSEKEKKEIQSLYEMQIIDFNNISSYIKLILRECFWCELYDDDFKIKIEFGYDYYIYITCLNIPKYIIEKYGKIGVFIEVN